MLDELEEQEAAKIYTALNYSPDLDNAANRRFASAYRKRYNATPTTYAMASYDAAQVLDTAIRLAGAEPDAAAASTWRSAGSGRSTARAATGSSTSRARRSSAGTCAGSNGTARCSPTC